MQTSGEFLDALDDMATYIRDFAPQGSVRDVQQMARPADRDKAFGGIQLIVSGACNACMWLITA